MNKQNYNANMLPELIIPPKLSKLLLHACCAPCGGGIIKTLQKKGIDTTVIFYNPNIYPLKEYNKRKNIVEEFANKLKLSFVELQYDFKKWFEQIKGHEHEPERGERCQKCFDMRLNRIAIYAEQNGFDMFATVIGISRWKDLNQVNKAGKQAEQQVKNAKFWDMNWRKKGGVDFRKKVQDEENFYQQQYCGCVFSLKDTNQRLKQQGKQIIKASKL